MNKKVAKAVNDQINAEFESAYSYLAMSMMANDKSLPGTSAWLHKQYEEELEHAHKLVAHVHSRGGSVQLSSIDIKQPKWISFKATFEEVLKLEKSITSKIHSLYELSLVEKDYPLQILLQWFITEQVEEEDSINTILDRIAIVGDSGATLFLLDRQLGER